MDIRWGIVLLFQSGIYTQLFPGTASQVGSLPAPECYNSTTCPCCNTTCSSDGSGRCDGHCLDGYHGGRCDNKCPSNCVKCVDALHPGANCTLCMEGYYSTPTQYQCQQTCPANCKTCDSPINCTSCLDGYFLTSSNQCDKCNEFCLTCTSSAVCTSCKIGLYLDGTTCKNCDPLCHSCASSDNCICSIGCSVGYTICDHTSGLCSFECKDNFTGGKCDTCIHGRFGLMCNESCSVNCDSECDRFSGVCPTCIPGAYGEHCDKVCPMNCMSACNKTTGTCDECKDGYYGNRCTFECQRNCKVCTITNGFCTTCFNGFFGDDCDRECSENCLLYKCEKDDGSCACLPGYDGITCDDKVTTPHLTTSTLFPRIVTAKPASYVEMVIGVSLSGAIIIVICFVGGIYCYRRRLREVEQGNDREKRKNKEKKLIEREITKLDVKMSGMQKGVQVVVDRRAELQMKLDGKRYGHTDGTTGGNKEDFYETLQRSTEEVSPYSSLNK